MSYDIQSKSDLLTGVSLIIKIPESEVDRKALYTIQADQPDFILPFRSRYVDGQVEFVYQVGTYSKLQYFVGERLPKEYAELWSGIFNPLIDCGDWFMDPYAFVLNAEYLYYDKNTKSISYVYIPSTQGCSGYTALKEMAAEVTRLISVADTDLENKVLRAIMKDFKPTDFLQMLKQHMSANAHAAAFWPSPVQMRDTNLLKPSADLKASPIAQSQPESVEYSAKTPSVISTALQGLRPHTSEPKQNEGKTDQRLPDISGDIIINIPENGKSMRKSKEKFKNNNPKKGMPKTGKKEKELKESKSKSSFLSVIKEAIQEISPEAPPVPQLEGNQVSNAAQVFAPPTDTINITQCTLTEDSGAKLRFVGTALLTPIIDVGLAEGEIFTIGRFDAAIGRQQSSFEFEKKTKAVSRRHAVIERHEDGYKIIDLSSSAGTFLNGNKLPPNTPCELAQGSRVSFGNAGADYVWEEI